MTHMAHHKARPLRLRGIVYAVADDDRGAVSIEYALIGVIVSLAIIAGLSTISTTLETIFAAAAAAF